MKTWDELSKKEATRGFFAFLFIFFFIVFSLLYRDYEDRMLKEHGVWTILKITHSRADMVYYAFQLNNRTYVGKVNMSEKRRKTGNRFFLIVIPNEIERHRIYDAVPEWFKLDAPPEGWKTRPANRVLYEMTFHNNKEQTPDDNVTEQNRTDEIEDAVKVEEEWDEIGDNKNKLIVANGIVCLILFVILILYRNKQRKYIEAHGVWTILTITKIEKTESVFHKKVHYTFQLNDQIYTDSITLSKKRIKSGGNRFFLAIIPEKDNRRAVYEAVPEWFTLDAPPEGWKERPTERDLREMMAKQN